MHILKHHIFQIGDSVLTARGLAGRVQGRIFDGAGQVIDYRVAVPGDGVHAVPAEKVLASESAHP